MDDELIRRVHRQVLLVVASTLLAVLAAVPWWADEAPDGEEFHFSGWNMLFSAAGWQEAGGGTDGLSWFVVGYVSLALLVLTAGALVPPDVLSYRFGYAFGVIAGCLGLGLAALALVTSGRSGGDEMSGAFHGAWITALVVSGAWFAWAADRRERVTRE